MRIVLAIILVLSIGVLQSQSPADSNQPPAPAAPTGPLDYVCPMDKDVRSDKPGKCPRCGMTLVLGIPDDIEYPLHLDITPRVFRAGEKVQLAFRAIDPHSGKVATHFEIVHDRLFHMFIASQDLKYFVHEHPAPQPDGTFLYNQIFPKPGLYRIAGDFYPTGATPQLVANTVIVRGAPGEAVPLEAAALKPELGVSHCENLDVELVMDPPQPVAGMKTLLFFRLKPADGLEQYLSAWAHMLVASDDLVDLIHDHPFIADGGPQMQFNIIFPRAHTYRIWVQFQRKGVVNTASFNVPVIELK